jgi:ATP-dependent RNA helicase HelY
MADRAFPTTPGTRVTDPSRPETPPADPAGEAAARADGDAGPQAQVLPADVARFAATLPYPLDDFQQAAVVALAGGASVLVAAPTGAGKTVVAEFCVHDVIADGGRCFYTTPIKALSNQKFRDLVDEHGAHNVGLLTGDRVVRGDAPVVVMTTEVLRNMVYERSRAIDDLRHVVMDEVHYLADRARGSVWEEVLIQLPGHVRVAALSATVSNAEEFGAWLDEVRGGVEVVISEHRPVPLRHHYYVNDRVYPTFKAGGARASDKGNRDRAAQARGGVPNPEVRMLERKSRTRNRVTNRGRRMAPSVRLRWPSRPVVVEELAHRKWLPAIIFVFSRAGCDRAVDELVTAGIRLTSPRQREEIDVLVDTLLADIPAEDLDVLDVEVFKDRLMRGVATHHAGMVPAFKEVVEECFQRGLLSVVVATETLALGINMPARTVVIERLEKWNGEAHVMLTPGEYTQLTGRAGRRGIDTIGHAIVLYQRDLDFRAVAGLVGTRAYPLNSSFTPSYNMVVNLLHLHRPAEAEELLGASFAQFQADRGVAGLERSLREAREAVRGYDDAAVCDRGDWGEYWDLRRRLSRLEKSTAKDRRRAAEAAQRDGIRALVPGDVLGLPWIGRRGLAAVTGVRMTGSGVPLADVVTDNRATVTIGPRELDGPPPVIDRIALPRRGSPRERGFRNEIAASLSTVEPLQELPTPPHVPTDAEAADEIEALRVTLRAHPCHACEDRADHEAWQRRSDDAHRDVRRLERRIEERTGSLVRRFRRLSAVLVERGLLDGDLRPTRDGLRLAEVYADVDLLVAESLGRGWFDDLAPAELAAALSVFTHEPRGGDEPSVDVRMPTWRLGEWLDRVTALAAELRDVEADHDLEPMRDLDAGFARACWRWTTGADLDTALEGMEMTGGDFVRNAKQVADLVSQVRSVAPNLAGPAQVALDGLRRGIVEA